MISISTPVIDIEITEIATSFFAFYDICWYSSVLVISVIFDITQVLTFIFIFVCNLDNINSSS